VHHVGFIILIYYDAGSAKLLLTVSLAKPRENADAILKKYDMFIYGHMRHVKGYVWSTTFYGAETWAL
jgi:hypothetical protein